MAPILTCIRHAQGYHNLTQDDVDNEGIPDPDLTKRGREQCERLRDEFPYHDQVDCIIASPIRRTIQTAQIGLQPIIEKKGLKILLAPRAQETSSKPSDTGSSLDKLEKEFGDKINGEERMTPDWNTNKGEWSMDTYSIERHVVELRRWIHKLECEHVALVAHGGFMHYFTEDWSDCPEEENQTGWYNTEYRTYKFLKGEGAHLQELEESRKRRSENPTGGFREENGPVDQE